MRTRSLLLMLMVVLIGAFAVLNWPLFVVPASLNLLFTTIEAPLGLVMLGTLVVALLVFAVYMVVWQGSFLLESHRHAKELKDQRALADQAEASRFTELRTLLLAETARLTAHVDGVRLALHGDIRDHANSLAASLAEFDDRMGRAPRPD